MSPTPRTGPCPLRPLTRGDVGGGVNEQSRLFPMSGAWNHQPWWKEKLGARRRIGVVNWMEF